MTMHDVLNLILGMLQSFIAWLNEMPPLMWVCIILVIELQALGRKLTEIRDELRGSRK